MPLPGQHQVKEPTEPGGTQTELMRHLEYGLSCEMLVRALRGLP